MICRKRPATGVPGLQPARLPLQRLCEQLGHVLRKSEARMSKPETNPNDQIVQGRSVSVQRAACLFKLEFELDLFPRN
jgi:hypothetical protein